MYLSRYISYCYSAVLFNWRNLLYFTVNYHDCGFESIETINIEKRNTQKWIFLLANMELMCFIVRDFIWASSWPVFFWIIVFWSVAVPVMSWIHWKPRGSCCHGNQTKECYVKKYTVLATQLSIYGPNYSSKLYPYYWEQQELVWWSITCSVWSSH